MQANLTTSNGAVRGNSVFLSNAFSLQMLSGVPAIVHVVEVKPEEVPAEAESHIGHHDMAIMLTGILGQEVPMNRVSTKLADGDTLYVAQYVGGRLPEGVTTLPPGAEIKFYRVSTTLPTAEVE